MFARLTDEDRDFIRKILTNPAEETNWLVYADWLEEDTLSDPTRQTRAEYIRLEHQRGQLSDSDPVGRSIRQRLEQLRHSLDPDWTALFDRPPIENCSTANNFKCPRRWELLAGTDQPCVRHCGVCEKSVHYCHDIETARAHVLLGECVAVRSGLPRDPFDLSLDPLEAEAWTCLLDDPRLALDKDEP